MQATSRRLVTGTILAVSLTLGASLPSAHAQPAGQRIRGTITKVAGSVLSIDDRAGKSLTVTITPDVMVTEIAPSSLADIKPGSYIGTAALPQADGSVKALEIQVFPEALRGVGEGEHPWDLQPQSTMTNGTVGDVVGTDSKSLTVKYKGQQTKVMVAANTPVITYVPGKVSELTVGAHVILTAMAGPDGTLSANRIQVGRDGLVPPM
jgi:hypothetical protein